MTPRAHSILPGLSFPAIPGPHASLQLALQLQLEQSQWLPPEELGARQLLQLEQVVRHAATTSPYYSALFASRGIRLPESIGFDFLRTLPVSTRADLQQAGDSLASTRLPPSHGKVDFATTSGSTGRPLRFARTGVTGRNWLAFALREHLWHQRDFTGKLCTLRFAQPASLNPRRGNPTRTGGRWLHRSSPRARRPGSTSPPHLPRSWNGSHASAPTT